MRKNKKLFLIPTGIIAAIFIAALYFNYNPEESSFFPKCPFYSLTSLYCPGCGSQRAIHKLLHGDIWNAIKHNFLIVLLFAVLVYDILIYLLKLTFKKEPKNILHNPKTTIIVLIVVILFWVLRNVDSYPFSILAP